VLQDRRTNWAECQTMMETDPDMSATVSPRTGADLRAARERLGYALPDVADWLRIKLAYLEALEDGRINDLPGVTYAAAFLRSYAQLLGLDPDEIYRRFKDEADEINHRTELEFPAPRPSRAIPNGALALLGVVLAVGAYAGWYRLSGEGRLPAETVTQVPARLAPLAQQAVPVPIVPPVVSVPAPVPAESLDAASPSLLPPPLYQPTQAAAMPLPPPPTPPPAATPATAAPVPAIQAESRMAVRAKATQVWIQIRERGGPVLLDKVLRPGESLTLPNRPNLLLTTGNALNTEFLVDGETTPGLGAAKGVKRELAMEPDLIKDGRFAAQNGGGALAPQAAPAGAPVTTPVVAPAPMSATGNGAVTRTQ